MKESLKVRQRIQLSIPEGQRKGNYYSSILAIVDDEIIVVASPSVEGGFIEINEGERINIFYWDWTAQYAFEAKVINGSSGSTPTVTLEKCSDVQRMQRRSFFRIPASLKVVFDIERDGADQRHYEGRTLNISGGGMLLSTNFEMEIGDNLLLKLFLSEQEYIEATGRIERLESLGTKELCQTAIVFVMIYENDRDRIIAYVFEREIELRRKGLL